MAKDLPKGRARGNAAVAARRRRKLISDLLTLDADDRSAIAELISACRADDARDGDISMLAADDVEAARSLVLFVADALLSPGIEPRIRLLRALRSAESRDASVEERRAFVVREIELEREVVQGICESCGQPSDSNECDLCGKPMRLFCINFLRALGELDPRFSVLEPPSIEGELKRWTSCTLVAAKLSIMTGAFGDSGGARTVQKRYDLAYRKVFGCKPASHEPLPMSDLYRTIYETTGKGPRLIIDDEGHTEWAGMGPDFPLNIKAFTVAPWPRRNRRDTGRK